MKKKPGFQLRDVCGEQLIIPQGIQNLDFSKMINLNETAAFIWSSMPDDAPFTAEDAANALVKEYEVAYDVALRDASAMLAQLQEEGIIEA